MTLSRSVKNVASVGGMRVFTALLGFTFFVLLARYWSKAQLGEFTTLWVFFLLLQYVPLLGLHLALIRDIAQRPEELDQLAVNLTIIGLIAAVVIGGCLGLAGWLIYPSEMHAAFWLVGVALVPTTLTSVSETIFTARERLGIAAAVSALESLVRVSIWIGLVLAGFGLTELFAALVVSRSVAAAVYLFRGGIARHLRFGQRSRTVAMHILRMAPTFLGILLLQSGLNRMDFVLLSRLGTMEQAGFYSAPYKLLEAALMLPTILAVVLFPVVSRAFVESASRFEQLSRDLIRFALIAGLPCAIALAWLARPLLVALFGADFARASLALQWLAVVPVLAMVNYTLGMLLQASHHQHLDLRAMFGTCLFYLGALVVLIPLLGIVGAAAATAVMELVHTGTRYVLVRRVLGVRSMLEMAARPVAGAAAMIVVSWALRAMPVAVALAAGVAVYAAVLTVSGAVTAGDLRLLRNALVPRERAV